MKSCNYSSATYVHLVGDAEKVSRNPVVCTIHKVVPAFTVLFGVFPGCLPTLAMKEAFYKIQSSIH